MRKCAKSPDRRARSGDFSVPTRPRSQSRALAERSELAVDLPGWAGVALGIAATRLVGVVAAIAACALARDAGARCSGGGGAAHSEIRVHLLIKGAALQLIPVICAERWSALQFRLTEVQDQMMHASRRAGRGMTAAPTLGEELPGDRDQFTSHCRPGHAARRPGDTGPAGGHRLRSGGSRRTLRRERENSEVDPATPRVHRHVRFFMFRSFVY